MLMLMTESVGVGVGVEVEKVEVAVRGMLGIEVMAGIGHDLLNLH